MTYMDALPSSEFRKRFHRLEYPTKVTVNGHLIGVWMPANVEPSGGMRLPVARISVPVPEQAELIAAGEEPTLEPITNTGPVVVPVGTLPPVQPYERRVSFSPAPKPAAKAPSKSKRTRAAG